ncbi:Release factor glutamine methyltransferase [Pseudoclavibacter triregionum]|nr:Release factor glutamine methyltransferase [Pseudoclavibacter triregionum]
MPSPSEQTPDAHAFDDPRDAPESGDAAALAELRELLVRARFDVDGTEGLLGAEAAEAMHRDLFVPAERALAQAPERGGHLGALIELLLLGVPVEPARVPALPLLERLRLAEQTELPTGEGERWAVALADLRPYEADGATWWIASDLGGAQLGERAARGLGREASLRRDHVVGIGPATTMLAQLTPREPVARAFDLGVGMGVQTMHLLSHAEHVTATDISARALAFARFNLLLNAPALGLDPERLEDRVALRLGSMLEPVAGERFDLVVSNPPFVITPRRASETAAARFTYRDGGAEGDRIVHDLVTGLPGILEPGGRACMLGNWEIHEGDETWHDRLGSWLADDLDARVVLREEATPVEYADMWLRDAAENAELDSWREAFAAYLRDFAARGVRGVGMGLLCLRRIDGGLDAVNPDGSEGAPAPLRRFESLPHQLGQPLGPVVAVSWDRIDWLRSLDDEALFDETFVVAGDVTEERHSRPGDEHPSAILLRQGGGFRRTYPLSTELAGFVGVCDGELAGSQIAPALAAILDVEETAIRAALAPAIRELVELGFLEPAFM